MARTAINANQVDAKSPIDEALMSTSIKDNDDDHETRIVTLEAGLGDVSGFISEDPTKGKIILGGIDNVSRFERRRFYIWHQVRAGKRDSRNAWDVDNEDLNVRLVASFDQDTTTLESSAPDAYTGFVLRVGKDTTRSFKSKKGENYFGIIHAESSTISDSVTIFVDGVAINDASLGIVNAEGVAVPATFSTNNATIFPTSRKYFFGLDPNKEQIITVKNTDSAAKFFDFSGIEVGFYTPAGEVSITLSDARISKGRAMVRGSDVNFSEFNLSFNAPTAYGRKDLLALTTAGTLSVINGAEPAFTTVKKDFEISDSVTTIKVKSSTFFPSKGFVSVSFPNGHFVRASYTGKTEAEIQNHTLTGVIWESDFPSFTPLSDMSDGSVATFIGDAFINLIADGTSNAVTVSSSNNKLDFTLAEDGGGSSTFAATIADGLYSHDILPLGQAIETAMQAAKALSGKQRYLLEYNSDKQTWIIGVIGKSSVDTISFLFSSGANQANSIHSDLGFADTDISGSFSYIAVTEKLHLANRTFDRGQWNGASSPNIKYNVAFASSIGVSQNAIKNDWGISDLAVLNSTTATIRIFTNPDAVGVEFGFIANQVGSFITAQINNGQYLYALQTSAREDTTSSSMGPRVLTNYVTFPKGTTEITLRTETGINFQLVSNGEQVVFVGYRELKEHKPIEKLTNAQAWIKEYSIRPILLFKEMYAHNYVVQVNEFEKIDSITKVGTWSSPADTDHFNGQVAQTTTQFDRIDITFTLIGNIGAIQFLLKTNSATSRNAALYITSGASASIAADNLISSTNLENLSEWHDQESMGCIIKGPGQFTVSIRKEDITAPTRQLSIGAIAIIDTVESDPDAVTVGELANDNRGISFPFTGVIKSTVLTDSTDRVPASLVRSMYKQGSVVNDIRIGSFSIFTNGERIVSNKIQSRSWYGVITGDNALVGTEFGLFALAETMWTEDVSVGGRSTIVTPNIDGRSDANYSQVVQVKTGSAPTVLRSSDFPLFKKNFFRFASADMSNSTTFLINDTRGMRVGQSVLITADSQGDELNVIDSITLDTNVILKRAIAGFANYTTANNAKINFKGFHRINMVNSIAVIFGYSSLNYLVLPVTTPIPEKPHHIGEVAVSLTYGVTNLLDLAIPIYEDGTEADWNDTTVTFLNRPASIAVSFPNGFKDILTGAAIDVKCLAIRSR